MDDSGQNYPKEQLDHLKSKCDWGKANIYPLSINLYELACEVYEAMGEDKAKQLNELGDKSNGQFVAMWVCFKFALLHENVKPADRRKVDNDASKKRARNAIKHLDSLILIIKEQAFSNETVATYPYYDDSDDDIAALEKIKNNQQYILRLLTERPLKHYHTTHLHWACSEAVRIASYFNLGTAPAKADYAPLPIEKMLAVVLSKVDRQSLNSALERARKRYVRQKQ